MGGPTHTHIFSVRNGAIRVVVINMLPEMDWNDFFNRNPEAGIKLSVLMLSLSEKG